MKAQIISLIGESAVMRVNMAAQILALLVGAVGFYEARIFRFVSAVLSRIAFLKQFFFHSRTVTLVENTKTGQRTSWSSSATGLIAFTPKVRPPGTIIEIPGSGEAFVIVEEKREDLPHLFYFTASAVALVVVIGTGDGILYWLSLPFTQFMKAFTVWSELNISWSAFSVPLRFLWHFVLAIIFFLLVYTLGVGTLLKSSLLITNWVRKDLLNVFTIFYCSLCLS